MKYNTTVWTINKNLNLAWSGISTAMKRMYPSVVISPSTSADIFAPDSAAEGPKFNIGPVVFKVPERAKDGKSRGDQAKLYIVVEGWIAFGDVLQGTNYLTTLDFGTQVGYFREKDEQLIHVYGVHYDMDEKLPGHPVFHAQMSTQADMAPTVEKYFNLKFDSENDVPRRLLRNVRTPTAQMDVFSVITQIGADHLVSKASSEEVIFAFAKLRAACDFFYGAGGRFAYLSEYPASYCYRSTHWYNRATSEAEPHS